MASSFVEYFTQRSAADRLAKEPADVRTTRRALVVRARQKRDAADALWAVSQSAEALALIRDAIGLYRNALDEAGTGETLVAKLVSLGIATKRAAATDKCVGELADRKLPEFDADVGSADSAAFRELGDAAATLDDALAEAVLVRREIATRRVSRFAMTIATAIVACAGLYFALRRPPPEPASASAFFADDPAFEPTRAIDGDPTTEWVLPDASPGWLDVRVDPARAVHGVRLTNGHNRDYNDRATRGYRIEAYDGDRLVTQASGQFVALVPHPAPVLVPLAAPHVDRVRVLVTSWFNLGGGIAEVRVE
jgi:hypothetical protein